MGLGRFIARVWLRHLEPTWHRIPAGIQAWCMGKRAEVEGRLILSKLRALAPSTPQISRELAAMNFEWTQDPAGGLLDFIQHPWVTCARGKGDCDDWARLWSAVLKGHGQVEELVCVSKSGSAHRMTVFTRNGRSTLLSNLSVHSDVPEAEKENLGTAFYGRNITAYYIFV